MEDPSGTFFLFFKNRNNLGIDPQAYRGYIQKGILPVNALMQPLNQ